MVVFINALLHPILLTILLEYFSIIILTALLKSIDLFHTGIFDAGLVTSLHYVILIIICVYLHLTAYICTGRWYLMILNVAMYIFTV